MRFGGCFLKLAMKINQCILQITEIVKIAVYAVSYEWQFVKQIIFVHIFLTICSVDCSQKIAYTTYKNRDILMCKHYKL